MKCFQVLPSIEDLKVHLNYSHCESQQQQQPFILKPASDTLLKLQRKLQQKLRPSVQETVSKVPIDGIDHNKNNLAIDKEELSFPMKRKIEGQWKNVILKKVTREDKADFLIEMPTQEPSENPVSHSSTNSTTAGTTNANASPNIQPTKKKISLFIWHSSMSKSES